MTNQEKSWLIDIATCLKAVPIEMSELCLEIVALSSADGSRLIAPDASHAVLTVLNVAAGRIEAEHGLYILQKIREGA